MAINGHVVCEGEPQPGAAVLLIADERCVESAITGADGHFQFTQAGETVVVKCREPVAGFASAPAGEELTLELGPAVALTFVLEGEPPPSFRVQASPETAPAWAYLRPDGAVDSPLLSRAPGAAPVRVQTGAWLIWGAGDEGVRTPGPDTPPGRTWSAVSARLAAGDALAPGRSGFRLALERDAEVILGVASRPL